MPSWPAPPWSKLDAAEQLPGADSDAERRCGRLLRERLTAELAVHEADESLRAVSNCTPRRTASARCFTVTPTETDEDWAAIVERLRAVPAALEGYRDVARAGSGTEAVRRSACHHHLYRPADGVGRRQRDGVLPGASSLRGPDALRADLDDAARQATTSLVALRDWMRDVYAPAIEGAPDTVGRERYARWSRYFNGTDLDLDEAYAYGWSEYHRLLAEMKTEAEKVLPGAGPWEALAHLDVHGKHIEGVDEVQAWLQGLMDEAIEALDGTHFELAERVRKVESRIAPPGGAAAPYYTGPSEDFSRPGRTWLPTMGETRFPVYDLVSTWYHEGVPGHHLQIAQWTHVADSLSRYQASIGMVSANAEGWALYAERLMDELGFLPDAERRLGYLDAQMMRACRVIVDIGMHAELEIPADSPFHPGRAVDAGAGPGVLRQPQRPACGLRGERADPLPVHAGSGHRLQAGRACLAAGPGERPQGARRRVRRQGLAHGGPVAGARWVWTIWSTSCRSSDPGPHSVRRRPGPVQCHGPGRRRPPARARFLPPPR